MNLKYYTASLLITLLFIVVSLPVLRAQDPTISKEITVVAPYEPSISDAFKLRMLPKYSDTLDAKKTFEYSISDKYIPLVYEITPLKPANISGEPLNELYRNYIKAGMGTYTTPYLEYFYNSGRDKYSTYGIHLKHLSSWGDIKDYAYSGVSNNKIDGFYRKSYRQSANALLIDLAYERNVHHFYGFKPEDYIIVPDKDDIKQRFSYIDAGLQYFSQHQKSNKWSFHHFLDFKTVADKYKSSEINVNAGTSLSKDTRFLKITEMQTFNIDASVDYYHNKTADSTLPGMAIFTLKPVIGTSFNEFTVNIGARADVRVDTTATIFLFPEADISIKILDERMSLRFGITGGLEHNSFYKLSRINPYIISDIPLNDYLTRYKFYFEYKGRLSNRFDLSLVLSTAKAENRLFYVNDTSTIYNNKFTVIEDNLNLLEVKTDLSYKASEALNLLYTMVFTEYSLANFTPWHEPSFRSALSATYNMHDKIIVNGEFFFIGKRFARDFNDDGAVREIKLDPVIDLNIGVEYRYTKLLSGFIRFNNLLGKNYQVWYNYPVQGFSFMGGITYSF